MKYYVRERKFEDYNTKTAGVKARDDVEAILESEGYKAVTVWPELGDRKDISSLKKIEMHKKAGKLWAQQLAIVGQGDTLFIQLPVVNNYFFLANILKKLRKRGVRIEAIVHDLELLRMSHEKNISLRQKIRMHFEEKSALAQCDLLIVHNGKMRDFLMGIGIEEKSMVCLGIFDYLISGTKELPRENKRRDHTLIIAGNLNPEKAGYIYRLPSSACANLYGVNYKAVANPNIRYQGCYDPEELPYHMSGQFGLIWDGETADSCRGAYGEYLKFNNPHKTSLYLAAGFPVVIWREAALAEFVVQNGVGIAAATIEEAADKIKAVSEEEYQAMLSNITKISARLRSGYYLRHALSDKREAEV